MNKTQRFAAKISVSNADIQNSDGVYVHRLIEFRSNLGFPNQLDLSPEPYYQWSCVNQANNASVSS